MNSSSTASFRDGGIQISIKIILILPTIISIFYKLQSLTEKTVQVISFFCSCKKCVRLIQISSIFQRRRDFDRFVTSRDAFASKDALLFSRFYCTNIRIPVPCILNSKCDPELFYFITRERVAEMLKILKGMKF